MYKFIIKTSKRIAADIKSQHQKQEDRLYFIWFGLSALLSFVTSHVIYGVTLQLSKKGLQLEEPQSFKSLKPMSSAAPFT
jgi:hypothetical protein